MKKKLALLIPAHNEGLIIQSSITSAIDAGLSAEDVYVVDDDSSDDTLQKILTILPSTNVIKVQHSGKAGAVYQAIKFFEIEDRYEWVHIADADSIFSKNYFKKYFYQLSERYVAAVGFVQSLRGNWLCSYRAITYTYGQHIIKRLQAVLGMIVVLPGPVTSYRTDILKNLNFFTGSVTEDFDLTLQIYRQKLGKIKYIPEAVNYTQDPKNLKDFYGQTWRWYKGFFQGVKRYKVGLKPQRIDLSVIIQLGDIFLFFIQFCFALFILIFARQNIDYLKQFIILDFSVLIFIVIYSAIVTRRARLLLAPLYFHFLKFIELCIYLKAFVEVILLNKFRISRKIGWEVASRRYQLSKKAWADFS